MELKSQDIYVALKLVVLMNEPCPMQRIGESLGLSASRVHASIQQLLKANLIRKDRGYKVISANLKEFLLHGIRFVFVPEIGEPCRGMATASFAPPLDQTFDHAFVASSELPHVWPDPEGEVRGISFSPLHKAAPRAARNDRELYELLALVDAIRGGRAHEREMAIERITFMLSEQKVDEVDRLKSAEYHQNIVAICEQFHVRKLALFGSAARRELRLDSDIDLLAEFEPGLAPAVSGLQEMKQKLSLLVNRPVDLVTPAVLNNPYRKKTIMRDLEELYVA